MELQQRERRRRVMDTSAQQARAAVKEVVTQFMPWRASISQMRARLTKRRDRVELAHMRERSAQIALEVRTARGEFIAGLLDAPQKVTAHSRIVDVERAFDELEAELKALQNALCGNSDIRNSHKH